MYHNYCDTFTVELDHLINEGEKQWLIQRIENREALSNSHKLETFGLLVNIEEFENYLNENFKSLKK